MVEPEFNKCEDVIACQVGVRVSASAYYSTTTISGLKYLLHYCFGTTSTNLHLKTIFWMIILLNEFLRFTYSGFGLVNSRKIFCCWFTMSNSRLGMIYTPGPSRTELIWSTGLHDRASQICGTAHQMGNCRPSYIIMSGACSSQLTNKCYPPVVVTKDMIWGCWYTRKRGLHIGEW